MAAVGAATGCGGRGLAVTVVSGSTGGAAWGAAVVGPPGTVADEGDDVGEGGVVAELELVVAFDAEAFADLGEDLGLLDGVDAEVGFEVEVEVEHVGGVAGLVGHHGEHLGLDVQVAAGRAAAGCGGLRVR